MSIDVTAASQALTCPTCGSVNVRRRRTLKSALTWFGLFVAFIVLAAVTPYPSPPNLVFGMGAWVFLFIALAVAVYAAVAKNRCKECEHKWR